MNGKKLFQRIPFTGELRTRINSVSSFAAYQDIGTALTGTNFPVEEIPFIMTRTNTESLSNNVDSFVIYTSAHPAERIKYTADTDKVTMNDDVDGGVF
jgi:hypothetical protein